MSTASTSVTPSIEFGGIVNNTSIGSSQSLNSSVGTSTVHSEKNPRSSIVKKSKNTKKFQDDEYQKMIESFPAKTGIKYVFGCNSNVLDGLQSYASVSGEKDINDRLIYVSGKQVLVYDPDSGRQYFLNGKNKNVAHIKHFSFSSNGRYISVCESTRADHEDITPSQVSVFNLMTFAKQKTIVYNAPGNGELICSAFSGDTKYLITLVDGHEYQIVMWLWEKEKIVKSLTLQVKVF